MSFPRLQLIATLSVSLLLILTACTPAATSRPSVPQATGDTGPDAHGYYPHQSGLTWTYLREDDTVSTPDYTRSILGHSILGGERVVRERMHGPTLDTIYFRRYSDNGVFLHRIEHPGATITYDPPRQEFPAPGQIRPDASWSGTSTETITYEKAARTSVNELEYTFMVLEQRDATVPAGTFPTYTIEFTTNKAGETSSQQLWFSPYYGTIRTPDDLVLAGGNILAPRRE